MGTVEDGLFDYDLGIEEQQLISNSQVITNNSQTPRDFPKQTPLNTTPLGPPPDTPIPAKPLPPILNVQMDNAVSDNKNRYVFCFWSLLVAKCIFREVYVNFILVGHTHHDINALFGRWSMALQKESFPTVPLLMKSFMKNEAVPTIPHLIQEVLDFKKFIANWILDGEESLMGHIKVHQFSSMWTHSEPRY